MAYLLTLLKEHGGLDALCNVALQALVVPLGVLTVSRELGVGLGQ